MEADLTKICDVCGRAGNIAFTERVGPFTIAVCHPCRHEGVTTGRLIAAEYRTPADQRQAKRRRHDAFRELPGPGQYLVTLPRRKRAGRDMVRLPQLCCSCLAPAETSFPAPLSLPASGRRQSRRAVGCIVALFLVPILVGVVAEFPAILIVVLPFVAGLLWLLFRQSPEGPPRALDVPVCRACLSEIPLAGPPAYVVTAQGPFVGIVFRNWEYAQLAAEPPSGPAVPA